MSRVEALSGEETVVTTSLGAVVQIDLDALKPGPSVRLGGTKKDHLAALVDSGGKWPPLLVRKSDYTIVDGLYRYLAARELGLARLECVYFEGSTEAAYLEALRRNLSHGLALTLRERSEAARRVLSCFPAWSDRRVAAACGLAPGTVNRLRSSGRPAGDDPQSSARLGRDGRCRPADAGILRERIVDALRAQPEGSLRSIARLTGSSPTTVRAVRFGLENTSRPQPSPPPGQLPPVAQTTAGTDPALVSTSEGSHFVEWLARTSITEENWKNYLNSIPLSRVYQIADEARLRAKQWSQFASALEARSRPGARD